MLQEMILNVCVFGGGFALAPYLIMKFCERHPEYKLVKLIDSYCSEEDDLFLEEEGRSDVSSQRENKRNAA